MRKKQWKARAKKAERELRDQKAVNAALQESVKRLRKDGDATYAEHMALMDDFNALLFKYGQLQRDYEELVNE